MFGLLVASAVVVTVVVASARREERVHSRVGNLVSIGAVEPGRRASLPPAIHVADLFGDAPDLPCPWCGGPTREDDTSCPSCGQRFG